MVSIWFYQFFGYLWIVENPQWFFKRQVIQLNGPSSSFVGDINISLHSQPKKLYPHETAWMWVCEILISNKIKYPHYIHYIQQYCWLYQVISQRVLQLYIFNKNVSCLIMTSILCFTLIHLDFYLFLSTFPSYPLYPNIFSHVPDFPLASAPNAPHETWRVADLQRPRRSRRVKNGRGSKSAWKWQGLTMLYGRYTVTIVNGC